MMSLKVAPKKLTASPGQTDTCENSPTPYTQNPCLLPPTTASGIKIVSIREQPRVEVEQMRKQVEKYT